MNYYALAEDEIKTLKTLFNAGQYRHAVYHSCLYIDNECAATFDDLKNKYSNT